jgi:AcrR family transcriptional regulator
MAPRIKTSERIVQNSLELFNQQGERSISTNHIAAHMEISPGNLYYHFPNKQAIIAVLFRSTKAWWTVSCAAPGRAATVEDKRFYLKELLAAMWRYRFLHRDLEQRLDSETGRALSALFPALPDPGHAHLRGLRRGRHPEDGSGADRIPDPQCLDHPHVVGAFSVHHAGKLHHLSEQAIKRGVYQVLVLEAGFVTDQARDAVNALFEEFYVPLAQALEEL